MKPSIYKTGLTVLGFLVLGIPYAIGVYTHDRLNQLMALSSKEDSVEIIPMTYRLGWLRSVGTSKLVIKSGALKRYLAQYDMIEPEKKSDPVELILHHEVQHGPVIWDKTSGMVLGLSQIKTTWDPQEVHQLLQAVEPAKATEPAPPHPLGKMELFITMTLSGHQVLEFSTPVLGLEDPEEAARLNLQPMTGRITLSRGKEHMIGLLLLPSLQLIGGEGALVLQDLRWEWDLQRHALTGAWILGNNAFSVQEADFQNSLTDPTILVTGGRATQQCVEEAGLMHCKGSLALERASVERKAYGPFHIELEAQNLDPIALAQIDHIHKRPERDLVKSLLQADYVAGVERLLSKGPAFEIKQLFLQTPEGPLSFQMKFGFSTKNFKVGELEKALQHIEAQAYIDIPQVIVKELLSAWTTQTLANDNDLKTPMSTVDKEKLAGSQAQEILESWLQRRWIVPKNAAYTATLSLENGAVTINGEAYSWEPKLQPAPLPSPSVHTTPPASL